MARRLKDVLTPYAAQWDVVVDAGSGDVDVAAFVQGLPGRPPVVPDADRIPPRALLVVTAGPDSAYHGDAAAAYQRIARADAGTDVLVLLGWDPQELAASGAAPALADVGVRPTAVAGTPYLRLPVVVLGVRDDSVVADPDARSGLEQALAAVAAEHLADEVAALRSRLAARGDDADPVMRVAQLTQERADLAARLRRMEGSLRSAERRLAQLEGSTSMRVGKALVGAAKNPRQGLALPRQAYRMWRMRGGRGGVRAASGAGPAPRTDASAEVRRLVAWRGSSLEPRDRLSIAGALRPGTAATLGRHAFVSTMTPDDAVAVLERTDPDLVLIETAVAAPSSPWAYLGDPAATERERRLLALVEAAQAAGRPVVLWRNTPVHRTAALDAFAEQCDLVVDSAPARSGGLVWSPGVSLAEAVDLGASTARTAVLHAGGSDPRDTAPRRALLEQALRAAGDDLVLRPRLDGPGIEGFDPELRARAGRALRPDEFVAACRDAAVVLAAPFSVPSSVLGLSDDHLLAVAAGARLVSGPNAGLAGVGGLGDAVLVASPDGVAAVVERARAMGPLADAEVMTTLRSLFLNHAVPARLRDLVERVGVSADVDVDRRVAVVVPPGTPVDDERLVEDVLAQRHRPVELAVLRSDLSGDRSLDELAAVGIRILVLDDPGAGVHELAWAVDAHWIAPWTRGGWSDVHVLDLAIGAEATKADAVGLGGAAGLHAADALDRVDAVLLRRDLLLSDAQDRIDLARWSRSGRRLVEVGSPDAALEIGGRG